MTEKMQAWQVTGTGEPADVLHLVDVDVPEPGPGQARIRVTAAGIGLPDVLMCRGTYPLTPPLPFIPGQEATGTVTAVGKGVDLAIGAPVMGVTVFYEGSGSFADECLVLAESAFAVPPGLANAEAAGFWIPHLTGWIGLVDRGRITPGDWLAVLGAAGGSGAAAVQLGCALGARVIATVSDEERAAFCRSLGAEATVIHRDRPVAPALRELTGGRGVDLVYDPVGGSHGRGRRRRIGAQRAPAVRRVRQRGVAESFDRSAGHDQHLAPRRIRRRLQPRRARGHPCRAWPAWSPTADCATRSPPRSRSTDWRRPPSPWPTET